MAKKTTTKTPVKKATATAKKATASKTTARKTAAPKAKATAAPKAKPVGPREEKLASSALKLVDEAAALLRKGIKNTATASQNNREEARKRAHGLLTEATSSLSSLLSSSSSALHKAISKL